MVVALSFTFLSQIHPASWRVGGQNLDSRAQEEANNTMACVTVTDPVRVDVHADPEATKGALDPMHYY